MRLADDARDIIRETVREVFGSAATIRLFGSRVDDNARGGDIDLLIELDAPLAEQHRKVLQLVARLQIRLGDQPIDVLVVDPETRLQPVHEEAMRTGVIL